MNAEAIFDFGDDEDLRFFLLARRGFDLEDMVGGADKRGGDDIDIVLAAKSDVLDILLLSWREARCRHRGH